VERSTCSSSSLDVPMKDTYPCHRYRNPTRTKTLTQVFLIPETTKAVAELADYAPAATSLFNNMKLPAAVVTAGMISLGFATSFPELPRETPANIKAYPPELRDRCESLRRLHIVVALIAVTSELIVVMWSAVEVNQLTEKRFDLAASVWDLVQRDCDLAWSAVNSHFVLGIIGFVTMLILRSYVMLLAAEASAALMTAALTGTGAALCLMISIVNRGVESGGGNGQRYGNTILDLFQHYAVLLFQASVDDVSPGPLQLAAIVLEITSLVFMANVLLFQNGKMEYEEEEEDGATATTAAIEDEECSLIEIFDVAHSTNGETTDTNTVRVVVGGGRDPNGQMQPSFQSEQPSNQRAKVARCLAIEDERETQRILDDEEDQRRRESDDSSVSIV